MVWERNNDSCTESIELLCCGNKDSYTESIAFIKGE